MLERWWIGVILKNINIGNITLKNLAKKLFDEIIGRKNAADAAAIRWIGRGGQFISEISEDNL